VAVLIAVHDRCGVAEDLEAFDLAAIGEEPRELALVSAASLEREGRHISVS
jgi:hypothetical protein